MLRERVGLLTEFLVGLSVPDLRLLSCFAVMPIYRDARDPGVMPTDPGVLLPGVIVRARLTGSAVPGVRRPLTPGVMRPFTGVTRPLGIEGVFLLLDKVDMEFGMRLEGVSRPSRMEATEDGRDILPGPTVGAESLSALMNTPHAGGQAK